MTITKLLYHPITIFLLTVVAIVFYFSLDKSSKKTQTSSENIRVLEHEVSQISSEIIELEEKIEETTSQQYQEKVIRNELLLQKPGEYVLQIADQNEQQVKNTDLSPEVKKKPLDLWLEKLF